MKIAFCTLGCKVNQADTASMQVLFEQAGYTTVDFADRADIYLINTCVVTNTGQRKSRQMINRAIRRNPEAVIIVTGCYPQTALAEVQAIPGVDVIIGNQNRQQVVTLAEAAYRTKQSSKLQDCSSVKEFDPDTVFEELPAGHIAERTRAFLKIQEGCNQFCTYCIIPYARGRLRSRSLENITEEVNKFVAAGYQEVVLIGIHLGCYGKETGTKTLYDGVQAALAVPGLKRLRLGSLESVEVEERLLDLMLQEPRFCHHLHLPLQSGCDKILAAMHRPYDKAKFRELVNKIRAKVPDIAITTDIIVGFPGETAEDFAATCKFAEEMQFAKIHIFPYSKRQGTPAASMPGQLTEKEKNGRAEMLAKIDEQSQQHFLKSMLGSYADVLFEQDGEGHSGNYQLVRCPGAEGLSNFIRKVKIIGVDGNCLLGQVAPDGAGRVAVGDRDEG